MGRIPCVQIQLSAMELEKFVEKIDGEIWIMTRDNRVTHAMEFEDIIHENLRHCGCSE
jgi:hypothetical protein